MQRYRAAMAEVSDETALTVPDLFDQWDSTKAYAAGARVRYGSLLYKCLTAHTAQESWTPDLTPAMWSVIDSSHAGTMDDPIPASRGMDYEYGKYYSDPEDGKRYLCRRGEETGIVNLQYLPHEVVGQYFEAA